MSDPAHQLRPTDSWLDHAGEGLENWLLNENYSPETVRSYRVGLKNLFAFLRERGVDDLADLNRQLIEDWQTSMRERVPPLKANSRSLYAQALRRLIEWGAERDIVDLKLMRAVARVRTKRRDVDEGDDVRQPIPEADLDLLMAHLGPRRSRMSIIDLRDRALFFFMLETGLRVTEALQVTRSNYTGGRIRQKGGSWVDFKITPTVIEFVSDYFRARDDELPWAWVKHGNNADVTGRLASSGVREVWRRLCDQLGIERFTTHQLRHTCGTLIHEEEWGDELSIAGHLHHADTRTAHRYVKLSDRSKGKVLDGFEQFIRQGTGLNAPRIAPELLQRRSPRGGRPRYR